VIEGRGWHYVQTLEKCECIDPSTRADEAVMRRSLSIAACAARRGS
jgi:hypothetical protein